MRSSLAAWGLALALLPLLAVAGGDGCTQGSEFEPPLCPLALPKITRLTVVENAIRSPAATDPALDCQRFTLTPALVRRYLSRARTTRERDAHFTLDWSGCSARGEIAFADGRQGRWSIDQGRLAQLTIGDAPALTLYCRRCAFGPFNRD